MSDMVPILFCDIDGTIRHGKDEIGRFVNTPEEVVIFDGVTDLLWRYRSLGWRIVGISNQAGVGLGYMDGQTCSDAMHKTNELTKYAFDEMLWCEHKPDANCPCRKPKPGMVMEGMSRLSRRFSEAYSSDQCLFVGDRPEDELCAFNSAIRFFNAVEWRMGQHIIEITAR